MKYLVLIFALAILLSCEPRHKTVVGEISSFEIIARSWNAKDKIILHLKDGREIVITYRGQSVSSGMVLFTDGNHYWIEYGN